MTKDELIQRFQLLPHPEGGYYRELWRSQEEVESNKGPRKAGTSIYFMLESENFSAFHRLKSDEIWYFHQGSPAVVHLIDPAGNYSQQIIGPGNSGEVHWQIILPAGTWFAAETLEENSYTFISCSVFPGFEFTDFELAVNGDLSKKFPEHKTLIDRLCRR